MVKIKVNVKTKNDSIPSDTTKRKMPVITNPKIRRTPRRDDTNVGDIRVKVKFQKDTVKASPTLENPDVIIEPRHNETPVGNMRNCKVHDYMHKASRFIVNYCKDNHIGNIVIGNNKDWKQNCNMGKVNNQNFVSIPFEKLISMIQYKCEEVGIKVIVTEESYTSKTDHYSDEAMCHHENYMGKRIKRGLFRSASGKLINADLNGAIGILRKVVGERLWQIADRGVVGTPSRIQFL